MRFRIPDPEYEIKNLEDKHFVEKLKNDGLQEHHFRFLNIILEMFQPCSPNGTIHHTMIAGHRYKHGRYSLESEKELLLMKVPALLRLPPSVSLSEIF